MVLLQSLMRIDVLATSFGAFRLCTRFLQTSGVCSMGRDVAILTDWFLFWPHIALHSPKIMSAVTSISFPFPQSYMWLKAQVLYCLRWVAVWKSLLERPPLLHYIKLAKAMTRGWLKNLLFVRSNETNLSFYKPHGPWFGRLFRMSARGNFYPLCCPSSNPRGYLQS